MHRQDRSRSRGRVAWIALALVQGAWAAEPVAPAPAVSHRPKVIALVVGEDAGAQAEVDRLESLSQAALGRSGKFEVLRIFDLLDPSATRLRIQRRQEAEAEMRKGMEAYNDLDTQAAQEHFERALKAYDETDLPSTFEAFIHAWVMKLAAQVANGHGKAAEKELEKLLPISPKEQFPSNYFGPDFIARAERLRKKLMAQSTVTFEIRTTPRGADVFVDGERRGQSPVSVPKLAPGEHLVSVVAPGMGLWQQAKKETVVEVALAPAELFPAYQQTLAQLSVDRGGKTREATAVEFARTLGADQVLLVVTKRSLTGPKLEVTAQRLEVSDMHPLGSNKGLIPLNDALPALWEGLLQPLLARDEPRFTAKTVQKAEAGFVWGKRATGLTLLGVGVVAIGASTFAGLKAVEERDAFRRTPQTDVKTSQAYQSSGQTFAVVADVSAVVGLIAVGTGGYFAFLSPEETPKVAPTPARTDLPMPPPPGPVPPPANSPRMDAESLRRSEEARQKDEAKRGQSLVQPEPGKGPGGAPGDGTRSDGGQTDGARTDGARTDGARADGVRSKEETRQKDEARRGLTQVKPEAEKAPAARKSDDARHKAEEPQKAEEERRRREAEKKKKSEDDDLRNY